MHCRHESLKTKDGTFSWLFKMKERKLWRNFFFLNAPLPFLLSQTAVSGLLCHNHQLSPSPSLMCQVSEREKSQDYWSCFKVNVKHTMKQNNKITYSKSISGVSHSASSGLMASLLNKTGMISTSFFWYTLSLFVHILPYQSVLVNTPWSHCTCVLLVVFTSLGCILSVCITQSMQKTSEWLLCNICTFKTPMKNTATIMGFIKKNTLKNTTIQKLPHYALDITPSSTEAWYMCELFIKTF